MGGPIYAWGPFRFEPTECRLLRDDEPVSLPAKTLDLLATLLRRAPRLVTKEEILAAVWPNAVVEEGNIAFHVAALRKVLDTTDQPSTIETVRGRGYRFVHPFSLQQMEPTEEFRKSMIAQLDPGPKPRDRTWMVVAAVTAAVAIIALAIWLR